MAPLRPRRLTSKDPRTIRKYNKHVKKELLRKKLPHELFELKGTMVTPPQPEQEALYNDIWERQQQIRQGAEKKCRKLKMSADPWSPKL